MDIERPKDRRGSSHREDAEPGQGSGFLGVGIGMTNVFFYSLLPVLLIFGIWTLVSVYAIVKWAGSAPDELNPLVLVVGIAWLVMLLLLLFAVGVSLIGRGMNPKKRAR